MSIRKENELPEDFMIRMGMYFSSTVREDYFKVAGEITSLRVQLAEWQEKAGEHANNSAAATTALLELQVELAALKEAVRPVTTRYIKEIEFCQKHMMIYNSEMDAEVRALAALVGEE